MINYERYATFRDERGMKDIDVARKSGLSPTMFSEWKKDKSQPKIDKMVKIADALEVSYEEFVGPVGKFSSYNPNRPELTAAERRLMEYAKRIAQLTGSQQDELENYLSYLESKGNKQ